MSTSPDRRFVLAGLGASGLAATIRVTASASSGRLSAHLHAALGEFLEANCFYHQAYRALPTGRIAITPPALRDQWITANVGLRRAVEAVMGVRSNSAEDVRMKMCVWGVFFMKECPPESYWAISEALRWNAVIDREAALFGVERPIVHTEFA